MTGDFATMAITLYAAHHVGDYWVQTDHQARHKGLPGLAGRVACLAHVGTYLATQTAFLVVVQLVTGQHPSGVGFLAGFTVSGVTHWMADRREHGLMFRLARALPGKLAFLRLGAPRGDTIFAQQVDHRPHGPIPLDNPCLGTGAWALDQSWHIFWGVFVAGLLMAVL